MDPVRFHLTVFRYNIIFRCLGDIVTYLLTAKQPGTNLYLLESVHRLAIQSVVTMRDAALNWDDTADNITQLVRYLFSYATIEELEYFKKLYINYDAYSLVEEYIGEVDGYQDF